ncbi:MAG: peptidylprolyl isomerase [Candidatus Schekmanbacteria bacterium]|nr:peptidylprolyl isomerase [Candidatus Schekmanbacteria bacterium]
MNFDFFREKKWFLVLMLVFLASPGLISCNLLKDKDAAIKVNDQKITQKEYKMIFAKELEDASNSFKRFGKELKLDTPEGKSIIEKVKESIKERMIDRLLVLDAAMKKNYPIDEKELDQMFSQFKSKMGDENFNKFLAQLGVDESYVKNDFKKQMVVQKYLAETFKDLNVNQTEIEAYFKQNKQKYDHPEMIRASHILVKSEQEAKDVLKELKKGADFSKLAVDRSIDPSAKQNKGDLDYFPRGVMDKDFENAVFALPVGKMSDVVKTRYGYHIIKVADKKAPQDATVEEARDDIITTLSAEKKRNILEKLLADLKKDAKIEINIEQEEVGNDAGSVEKK